jgi:PAS domain S-box-containing protein
VEPDFQRILEGFPGQVLVLAPDGPRFTILAASDVYLRATLTERAEIIGKGVFEVFPDNPDDPEAGAVDALRASFQRVVDERRGNVMGIRRHDVRRPKAEGGGFEEHYWQPLNSPSLGDDGQVACIVNQVEDVTDAVLHGQESAELRAANVALRESSAALALEVSGHEATIQGLETSQLLLASSLEAQRNTTLFSIDHDYRYLYFNKAHVETMKRAYGADIEIGACALDYISDAENRPAAKENYDRALAGESHTEVRVYGDTERSWFESFFNPVLNDGGEIVAATGMARDITARKRAEEQLAQMTRLYATLSQVNQTIVHVKGLEELYPAICDVAVEFGEFTLAWVGLLDEASGDVRPVAANGIDVALWPFETVNIHRGVSRNGLVATAIRSHEIAITGDVESDEKMRSVLGKVEGRDYHAIAAIPIGLRGETVGVLVLVSQRAGLFKEAAEIGLLEEIGQDISFALEAMALEAERERAAEDLAAHATRLEIMSAASATLAEVGQDFEAVLDGVTRLVSEMLADICEVRLLSEDGERLEHMALHALDPGAAETLRALEGQLRLADASPTMWHVLKSGEPLFAPVIAADDVRASVPPEVWPAYESSAPHSCILVPLRAQGRVTGLLSLSRTSSQRRAFTKDDLDLAQDLADRAALAISNASLLRQVQRELAERTQAQDELRESRAQLDAALTSMADAVFISDAEGNFIEFNDAFATFHRFASKAECAVTLAEYPDFLDVFMADGSEAPLGQWAVPRALRGETGTNVEYGLRRRDTGESWTGSYTFAPIRDAAREIVGSVVVGRDVTEQKAAETALRESEEALYQSEGQLRTLIDTLPDLVWLKDPEGVYLSCNRRFESFFGATETDIVGKTDDDFMGADLANAFQHHDQAAMVAGGPTANEEEIVFAQDGHREVLETIKTPVHASDGRLIGVLGVGRDITERKRAQEGVRHQAEQLRRTVEGAVLAMGHMVESRDPYTAGHERRVAELASAIGAEMGVADGQLDALGIAGTIHDIGKIAVPAEILSKPGRLSDVEFSIIKAHPTTGFDILADVDFGAPVAEMVLQHHERLDGSGYPRGLSGAEILPEACILAVADVVEAMSSHRPYRAALGMEAALAEVREHAGVKYDADVVAACARLVEEQGFQFTS